MFFIVILSVFDSRACRAGRSGSKSSRSAWRPQQHLALPAVQRFAPCDSNHCSFPDL